MIKNKAFRTLLSALALMAALGGAGFLCACEGDPVDEACDTIEEMDSTKDKTQDALDAFNEDADSKDDEAQAILDMVE